MVGGETCGAVPYYVDVADFELRQHSVFGAARALLRYIRTK